MTIIAAVQDPETPHRFYLAADSAGTSEGLVVYCEPKWVVSVVGKNPFAFAQSGDYRGGNVVAEFVNGLRRGLPSLPKFIRGLKAAYVGDGWSDTNEKKEDSVPDYGQSFLFVGNFGTGPILVAVDNCFGYTIYPLGQAAFDGAGQPHAASAWHALADYAGVGDSGPWVGKPEAALHRAVQTAVDLCRDCAGHVDTWVVDF